MFHDLKQNTVLFRCFGRVRSGVALISVGQIERVANLLLYLFGRCDLPRYQLAKGVDRDVDLRSRASFGLVNATARP